MPNDLLFYDSVSLTFFFVFTYNNHSFNKRIRYKRLPVDKSQDFSNQDLFVIDKIDNNRLEFIAHIYFF